MSKITNEPFAYAAVAMDASESTYVTTSREQAESACREHGWQLVPLYAGPTFTAAEREAVEWFAEVRKPLDSLDGGEYVAALRALRERIGREVFDRLCAVNAPKQERTADTHATQAQGSVQGQ